MTKVTQPSLLTDVGSIVANVRLSPVRPRRRRQRRTVLSALLLGGGLQSSCILEMVFAGEYRRPDVIVFNDTGSEPYWVYDQVGRLRRKAGRAGIPFEWRHYTCFSLADDVIMGTVHGSFPVFTKNDDGSVGRLRRQCTDYYKIKPGNLAIKEWLIRNGHARCDPFSLEYDRIMHSWRFWDRVCEVDPYEVTIRVNSDVVVETWYGYTTDEMIRADRKKTVGWQVPVYPLIEMKMARADCEEWYRNREMPVPKKSACVFCPYRSDEAWQWMKDNEPETFERACEIDDSLRTEKAKRGGAFHKIRSPMFVHSSCVPLWSAQFDTRRSRSLFELELVESCRTDGGFSCMS